MCFPEVGDSVVGVLCLEFLRAKSSAIEIPFSLSKVSSMFDSGFISPVTVHVTLCQSRQQNTETNGERERERERERGRETKIEL